MTLKRITTVQTGIEVLCGTCDTIHDEWYEHKTNQVGSSRIYVECDCVPEVIFQQCWDFQQADQEECI